MDLPPQLAFDRLDDAEKYRRAVPGYMQRIRDLYEAIHDRFGEEGLDLIREVSRGYGERIATRMRERGAPGVVDGGVDGVGRYLLRVFDMVGADWEVAEYDGERLVIRVYRCPYPMDRDEICRAHTSMEEALVAGLDGRLDYCVGCSIPRGDAFCDHVLSIRAPDGQRGSSD